MVYIFKIKKSKEADKKWQTGKAQGLMVHRDTGSKT